MGFCRLISSPQIGIMEEALTSAGATTGEENKKKILVFGKHEYILENVEGILQRAGFETHGFLEVEEASSYVNMNAIDAVLIGGGVDPHDRMAIKELIAQKFPTIAVVEHFGGPATIVSELKNALKSN